MKQIRTIIVDDEPAARARVARLLAQDPTIEVVSECRNGQEALNCIAKCRPDLLFLDVQMPGMSGFEVMEHVHTHNGHVPVPFVVFVTAHDQYALKAFDVNAVDYLLKPFDDDRFMASLEKAKRFIEMRVSDRLTGKLMDLVREHMQANGTYTEHFTIKDKGREHKVKAEDILYLRAEGNYLCLQLKERSFLYRMTMNAVESELDPARFMRIHRSYIVNRAHVRSSRYSGNNEFIFSMANNERIVSGRSYKEQIAKMLTEQVV
ncbi:MAG: LytR/AlgR family response regulator transcription factor [Flavobacteriales bacterium]|jgi:two-component system LytT family response regulator